MAHAGQVLEGVNGYRLRFVTTAAETDGQALEMEASYEAEAPLPPEHFHPNQAETFEVREGSIRTVIDGVERTYEAGETFAVPAATPHQMAATGPARMGWTVRPALRTAEMFEVLLGAVELPEGADFLEEFSAEFRLTGA